MTVKNKKFISFILAFILTVLSVNTGALADSAVSSRAASGSTGFKFVFADNSKTIDTTSFKLPFENPDNKTIRWSSSNTSVATIANDGTITPRGLGKTIITATAADNSGQGDKCILRINNSAGTTDTITFASGDYDIEKNAGVKKLDFTFTGNDVAYADLTISGDDKLDAYIESFNLSERKGTIAYKGKAEGAATITVNLYDKNKQNITLSDNSVTVNVIVPLHGIVLNPTNMCVTVGDNTQTITATKIPADTSDKTDFVWKSSNPEIASVNIDGKINAISEGTVNIEASREVSPGNIIKSTCAVKVIKNSSQSIRQLYLDKSALMLYHDSNVREEKQYNLEVTTYPSIVPHITWSTSKIEVASVDESGTVFAHDTGVAVITATDEYGNTATCVVSSNPKDGKLNFNNESIELVPTGKKSIEINVPDDFNAIGSEKIQNEEIATKTNAEIIKENEIPKKIKFDVTAVTAGETSIEIKFLKSDSSVISHAFIPIVVTQPDSGVEFDESPLVINKGQSLDVDYTIKPDNTRDKKVTFSSDDASIFTCDENGTVTAVAEGVTNLTAITVDARNSKAKPIAVVDRNALETELNNISDTISLKESGGESKYTSTQPLTSNSPFTWVITTQPDDKIATANIDGTSKINVEAKGVGSTSFKVGYCWMDNGDTKYTVTEKEVFVNVTAVDIPVQAITLTGRADNAPIILRVGDIDSSLTATFDPINTTDKEIEWVSSNPDVVQVTAGSLYALSAGTAKIYAQAKGGTPQSNKIDVIVSDSISELHFKNNSIKMNVGETLELDDNKHTKLILTDGTGITYTSSPSSVVEINNGVLVARSKGNATVTASALDGKLRDTLTVTVEVNKGDVNDDDIEPGWTEMPAGYWTSKPQNKVYTGSEIQQDLRVYKHNQLLTKDTDYTLAYENNVNVGTNTAKVIVKAKGSHSFNDISQVFSITAKDISGAAITLDKNSYDYTGNQVKPVVTVKDGNVTLVENKDYSLKYENNVNAGNNSARVIVNGINNYSGSKTQHFTIKQEMPTPPPDEPGEVDPPTENKGLRIESINDQIYTGTAIKPVVKVYYDDFKLIQGTDYTVSYKNNTNAYTAHANDAGFMLKYAPAVYVKMKGAFANYGTIVKPFVILPKDISSSDVTTTFTDAYAAPKSGTPALKLTVKHNTKTLTNNKDYVYTVRNSSNNQIYDWSKVGTYKVCIKGTGNYTGDRELSFNVTNNILMSKVTVSSIKNQKYTGSHIRPEITVRYGGKPLEYLTDYSVTYENNVDIGTATAIIKGNGKFCGTVRKTFKITGDAITKAKVVDLVPTFVYDGTPREQNNAYLTYKISKDETVRLRENKDYVVSYANNVNKGTATVFYIGINAYTGTLKKTYRITAHNLANSNVYNSRIRVFLDKDKVPLIKGQAKATIHMYDTIDGKYILLREGVDYTLSYANNRKVGNIAKITIKGKGNYTGTYPIKPEYTVVW